MLFYLLVKKKKIPGSSFNLFKCSNVQNPKNAFRISISKILSSLKARLIEDDLAVWTINTTSQSIFKTSQYLYTKMYLNFLIFHAPVI